MKTENLDLDVVKRRTARQAEALKQAYDGGYISKESYSKGKKQLQEFRKKIRKGV